MTGKARRPSLLDIDTSQPLVILGVIQNEADASVQILGEITLGPPECAAFITWLRNSKSWRATATRGLFEIAGGAVGGIFDRRTFVRMLGMRMHPCTEEAARVLIKLGNWTCSLVPEEEMPPVTWNRNLEQAGKRCVFLLRASALWYTSADAACVADSMVQQRDETNGTEQHGSRMARYRAAPRDKRATPRLK